MRSVRLSRLRAMLTLLAVMGFVLNASPVAAQVIDPEMIICPEVEGYEPTFRYEERVSFNTGNGGYRTNCWYQSLNTDESGAKIDSELILDAYWGHSSW